MAEQNEQGVVIPNRALAQELAEANGLPSTPTDIIEALSYFALRRLPAEKRDTTLRDVAKWDDATFERAVALSDLLERELAKRAFALSSSTDETFSQTSTEQVIISVDQPSSKGDSHPQSLVATERLADETPVYERLLSNVPDKLSAPSPKLTNLSEKRWEALRKTLKTKCGIDSEEITEAWLHILLKDFLQQPTQNKGRALPNDRNDMFAAIFWKYMQGADTHQILGAAARHNTGYARSPIGAVRTSIINFAVDPNKQKIAPKRQPREEQAYRRALGKVPPKRGKFIQDPQHLADLDALNRAAEQAAEEAYVRQVEIIDTVREWAPRVSGQLAIDIGGTEGAYSQILGMQAEGVADNDVTHARGILWNTIQKNVAARRQLPVEKRLTNKDVQLLAPLCGKKLIVQDQKLKDVDAEPCTVQEIRALVQRASRNPQQFSQSPEAVETIIYSALNKLIDFSKKPKRK